MPYIGQKSQNNRLFFSSWPSPKSTIRSLGIFNIIFRTFCLRKQIVTCIFSLISPMTLLSDTRQKIIFMYSLQSSGNTLNYFLLIMESNHSGFMWFNISATITRFTFSQITRTKNLSSPNISNVVISLGLKFDFIAHVWTPKVIFDVDISLTHFSCLLAITLQYKFLLKKFSAIASL